MSNVQLGNGLQGDSVDVWLNGVPANISMSILATQLTCVSYLGPYGDL